MTMTFLLPGVEYMVYISSLKQPTSVPERKTLRECKTCMKNTQNIQLSNTTQHNIKRL